MTSIFGTKWGASNTLGTAGGVVTWSIIPGGTTYDSAGFTNSTTTTSLDGALPADYITQLGRAFDIWARAANIEFIAIEDQGGTAGSGGTGEVADIRIGGSTIDGVSGTLGFAFAPRNGDVFFDTEESWTSDFFFRTALHEIGHTIGLDHVEASEAVAVMNPFIGDLVSLQPHDLSDVRLIYGADPAGGAALTTLNYVLPSTLADLSLIAPTRDNANVNLTGNALANTLGGDSSNNILSGLAGNDTLNGGTGNDTLIGGTGADTLNGGAGSDTASYSNAAARVDARLNNGTGFDGDALNDVYSSIENLAGSNFDDLLLGDNGANALSGGNGNDALLGLAGIDIINGGAGNDILSGGTGGDTLNGSSGNDTTSYATATARVDVRLNAGRGFAGEALGDTFANIENVIGSSFDDLLFGSGVANSLNGGGGNDTLIGGALGDTLIGGAGTDLASYLGATGRVVVRLDLAQGFQSDAGGDTYNSIENVSGSNFDDILVGDGGANTLAGGDGNDLLIGGAGADPLSGSTGSDTASYQNAGARVTVRLDMASGFLSDAAGDSYSSIENATGSNFDDVLIGDSSGNALNGGAGDDLLLGWGGGDALNGGTGTDTATYQNATSRVAVRLDLGLGFLSDAAGDSYTAIENLIGSNFDDTLVGEGSANALTGGAGDDLLIGGAAGDALDGGAGADTVSYQNAGGAVTARLNTATGIAGDAAGDTFTSVENLTGGNFNDTLLGSFADNVLSGLAGNDTLRGGAGDDLLTGGTGADALDGSTGNDTASYAAAATGVTAQLNTGTGTAGEAAGDSYTGIENLIGGSFNDMLLGSFAANVLTGGAGSDSLLGGGGDDVLIGGAGGDSLNGGTGNDTASYAGAATAVNARLNTGAGISGDAAGDSYTDIENLTGGDFNDTLLGSFAANTLTGGAGDDTLLGGGGDDLLTGGAGADAMNGGTGTDTASYAGAAAGVTARLNTGDGIAGEATGDRFTDIENLIGSAFDDTLFGSFAANTLTGGAGDDILAGGGGNDIFVFDTGDGADTINDFAGGAGAGDVIFFDNGATAPNNFADVQAAAAQNGADTVITFGSDTITLLNFMAANLAADDFMF